MTARFQTSSGRPTLWARATCLLSALLLAFVILGGSSPELHDHFCDHHHAAPGSADHCVFAAFAAGQMGGVPCVTVSVEPLPPLVEMTLLDSSLRLHVETSHRLLPSRAPPMAG